MTKAWYLSKAFWGAILIASTAVVPLVLATKPELSSTVVNILWAVGSALGLVGVRSAIAANGSGA